MTHQERLAVAQRFTEAVREWHTPPDGKQSDGEKSENAARLAMLRRNSGVALGASRHCTWFYGFVPAFKPYSEDALFLAATLLAFDRPYLERRRSFVGNLGKTINVLWRSQAGESAKEDAKPASAAARRLGILLDSDYDHHLRGELPFRLRQTVRWVVGRKEDQVGIDWPVFLDDIQRMAWNLSDDRAEKAVQTEWAKEFYARLP